MKRKGAIVGLIVIVAALAFSAHAFKTALISYVPFADARNAGDTTVQIMGAPFGKMRYSGGALYFSIRDEHGSTMPVVFHGPKPDDLDTAMDKATKIGAQGTFDRKTQQFMADSLQVKCPSKYDGAPTTRDYGASKA